MFKKQLNRNINELDLQIGRLNKELNRLEKDNKYEAIMDKLKDLTELRVSLTKSLKDNEKSDAILGIDNQIEELSAMLPNMLRNEKHSDKMQKLEELTKIRCQLAESKVGASVKPILVSGLLSIASVVIVLKYEETEVITSKAFNMATSMFRGSK